MMRRKSESRRLKEMRRSDNADELELRAEICRVGREIEKSGLALYFGVYAPGNLSARNPSSTRVLVTPSGLPKGVLRPADLVAVDLHGTKIDGRLRPSTETPTHCAIYKKRPDVNGIVHVHPPMCMAYAVTNRKLEATTIELAAVAGGPIPVARYDTPGTEGLGRVTAEALGSSSAVIMQNHGLIAVGPTLKNAFETALSAEYTAMVNVCGRIIGDIVELPLREAKRIRKSILESYGQRQL